MIHPTTALMDKKQDVNDHQGYSREMRPNGWDFTGNGVKKVLKFLFLINFGTLETKIEMQTLVENVQVKITKYTNLYI